MHTKTITILLITMLAGTFSFAQGFHIGVKGGVNMFKIDGRSFNEEFKYGYNAGLFSEIDFSEKLGIQPELLWNQSQTRTTNEFGQMYDEGVSELRDVKLNYLSIPVLLSYKPSKILSLQAGPQFGILINKDQRLLVNGERAFKTGDLSVLGGVQLNIGSAKVGGRYVVGLTNINDIDNQDKWKNQGFQLYVGFRFL